MHEIQPSFDLTESPPPAETRSVRERLVEQVVRDTQVLAEDSVYHVPSREFYEQRIASYKQTIAGLP